MKNFNNNKTSYPIFKKWAKNPDRRFYKESNMVNKPVKRRSAPLPPEKCNPNHTEIIRGHHGKTENKH